MTSEAEISDETKRQRSSPLSVIPTRYPREEVGDEEVTGLNSGGQAMGMWRNNRSSEGLSFPSALLPQDARKDDVMRDRGLGRRMETSPKTHRPIGWDILCRGVRP